MMLAERFGHKSAPLRVNQCVVWGSHAYFATRFALCPAPIAQDSWADRARRFVADAGHRRKYGDFYGYRECAAAPAPLCARRSIGVYRARRRQARIRVYLMAELPRCRRPVEVVGVCSGLL